MFYTCLECGKLMVASSEVKQHRQEFPEHGPNIVGQVTEPEKLDSSETVKNEEKTESNA